jgi:hypothetical protein
VQSQVVHLWQMPAEGLLALDRPPLLALVGQNVACLTDEAAMERLLAASIRSARLGEFQAAMMRQT